MMHPLLVVLKINVFYSKLPNLKSIYMSSLKHSNIMQGNLRLLYIFSVYPSEAGLVVSETLREALETDTLSST